MNRTPPWSKMAPPLAFALLLAACAKESGHAEPQVAVPNNAPGAVPTSEENAVGMRLMARLELPVEGKPVGVLAEDLNGDGYEDLLIVSREPGRVQLKIGTGEGPGTVTRTWNIGDWPLPPGVLRGVHATSPVVVVASQSERELIFFDFAKLGSDPIVARESLELTPRVMAIGTTGSTAIRTSSCGRPTTVV